MIKYLIWLQECLGFASVRAIKAIEYFKTAQSIYNASEADRKNAKIFTKHELQKMSDTSLENAEKIIRECRDNDIEIVGFGNEKYPYSLSVIDDAPLVIYLKGDLSVVAQRPTICIVGPRNVTEKGKKSAYSLSFRLALAGFTVVSGGAIGTDTYAHAGALKAEGKTLLCLGCGIMYDYLSENKRLRETVSQNGCLISEYPPFYPPSRYTFPQRNRIMSALSLGTVVVEAKKKSGGLITARHALEQGKDVFVIPGPVAEPEYEGSNLLLRDGAKPLIDTMDIFEEYIYRFPNKIDVERAFSKPIIDKEPVKNSSNLDCKEKIQKNQKKLPETLSKNAKIVYNYLDKQKFLPEDISVDDLSDTELISALTELEMEFLIRAIPGGMYELV